METEIKISIIVALVLILTAFFLPLRISAGLATVYLIVYAVRRLRKRKPT